MEFKHISVLLDETIEELHIKPDGIYVDGTLGGGGHAYHVCQKLSEKGRYIGIDQDADAIAASTKRLAPFKDKVTIVRDNYVNMPKVLHDLGIEHVDGILLDLGVSSFQLDEKERGFTYREDVPLDMRMDQRQSLTARDIVNDYSEMELFHIIRDYGEEKFAKNIAKHIVNKRKESPIETTGQLIEVIKGAIPMKVRAVGGHPAKKTFQAIRIECNRELDVLKDSIDAMIDLLNPGGRLCIITFHSLEDRIVKRAFKKNENPCTCPPNFPVCVCGNVSKGKQLTRKPIIPGEEELEYNKRAKSSKLRVFERAYRGRRSMDKTRQERYNMIYGNTARKIEASTQPASTQPERKQRPRRKVQTTPQTKQNQKRVQSIDLAFIKVLVAGICVIAAMSFFYLSERAQFMKQKSVLSDSKTQLNTLQVENEDMNLEIEQSIKFDTIETAAKKYGMSKPDASHILRYESQDAEYIRQYGKIPNAD